MGIKTPLVRLSALFDVSCFFTFILSHNCWIGLTVSINFNWEYPEWKLKLSLSNVLLTSNAVSLG